MYLNNFKYITVLFAFSESERYKQLPEITPKTYYPWELEKIVQTSEKMSNDRLNAIIGFISLILSSIQHELQNLFSAYGVARNDFFSSEKIFKTVTQQFPIQCQ